MPAHDRNWQRLLDDYAAALAGKYRAAADLPEPSREVSQVSEIWLKITDVPENYDQMVLQVDLYRWDVAKKTWSTDRWASGDRQVFGKGKLWQQHLSLTAPRGAPRAAAIRKAQSLPAGKYLARIYIDRENKLARQYPAELGEAEFVGQVELESRWPSGYQQMTAVRFP